MSPEIFVLQEIHQAREAAEKLGFKDAVKAFDDIEHAVAKIGVDPTKILPRTIAFLDKQNNPDIHNEDLANLHDGIRMTFALDHVISDDLTDGLFQGGGCSHDLLEIDDMFRENRHLLSDLYDEQIAPCLSHVTAEEPVMDTPVIDIEDFPNYLWTASTPKSTPS